MRKVQAYTSRQLITVIAMVFSLVWLTISLPFVNGAQLQLKFSQERTQQEPGSATDNSNPLSNTIEEKSESGPLSISEYLHDQHASDHIEVTLVNFYKCHPADLYYAFHPELLSPPPEELS
jgi:hypothetical protein